MIEAPTIEKVALTPGPDGVLRVRGTRVTLDTVVSAFQDGATPEEIAGRYPSLALADIYQVIGYYLRHASELSAYFERRQRESAEAKRMNETKWPPM